MNNVNINLHDYYNKLINLYNYTLIDMSHFKTKLCKFYHFFIIHPPRSDLKVKDKTIINHSFQNQ